MNKRQYKKRRTLLNVMLVGGANLPRRLCTKPNKKTKTKQKPNPIPASIKIAAHYSMVGGASTAEGAAKQIYTRHVNGAPA